MAGLFGLEPMPRMRALLNLRAVPSVKIVLGDRIAASLTSLMPAASIVSRVTAVTLTGTFWRSSGSFCAVTVTVGILKRRVSSSVGVAIAPAGTGVWPDDGRRDEGDGRGGGQASDDGEGPVQHVRDQAYVGGPAHVARRRTMTDQSQHPAPDCPECPDCPDCGEALTFIETVVSSGAFRTQAVNMPQIPIHYYDCDALRYVLEARHAAAARPGAPDRPRQPGVGTPGTSARGSGEPRVMNTERMRTTNLTAAVLAAAIGVAAPGIARAQAPAANPAPAAKPAPPADAALAVSSAIEATASAAGAAVVEIFTMSYAPTEGRVAGTTDLVRTQRATGSGAIVDASGFIVTNAHVVRGAQRIRVEVPTVPTGGSILGARGRLLDGRIVGLDLETDLAVIKVEATGLPTLTFGDSDDLRAGQIVVALGSPLGFNNSVSLGVVSAVARQLEPESPMVYVQSDAAISSGSSGGPLVDLRGRIVGINTLVASREGAAGEGLGFAAPSNIVRAVYEQLRQHGRVRRGDIGVRPQTLTPVLATGLGLARDHGVVLADVLPGGPAAQAGLRPGDVVVALDGKPMENGRQLQVGLYRRGVGDVVALDILREGQPQSVRVTMSGRRDSLTDLSAGADPRDHVVARLGILGVDLNPTIARMLPPLRIVAGVLIVSTTPGVLDTRDGELRAGDVIHVVNRQPVAGMSDLRAALAAVKTGDPVVLHVERGGELLYVTFVAD